VRGFGDSKGCRIVNNREERRGSASESVLQSKDDWVSCVGNERVTGGFYTMCYACLRGGTTTIPVPLLWDH
jgi:hypothetical protein